MSNDQTLPMLIASSGEYQKRSTDTSDKHYRSAIGLGIAALE